jgi:hypothetical protein
MLRGSPVGIAGCVGWTPSPVMVGLWQPGFFLPWFTSFNDDTDYHDTVDGCELLHQLIDVLSHYL